MSPRDEDEPEETREDEGKNRFEEMVEIYRCAAELEANRVIDELLYDFDAVVHNRISHALPAPPEMGSYFIAVPVAQAEAARAVLAKARTDGELFEESGTLIGG